MIKQKIGLRITVLLFLVFFTITGLTFKPEEINLSYGKDTTVCITRTGKKYHKCYHYSGSNTEIKLSEAKKQGYTACKVCKP